MHDFQEALTELNTDPTEIATSEWSSRQEEIRRFANAKVETDTVKRARADKALLAKFTGPTDPGFIAELKKKYTEALVRNQVQLKKYQEGRP